MTLSRNLSFVAEGANASGYIANTQISGVITSTQLASSGVSAGTYGGATQIPVVAVGSDGRVTSAANVSVSSTAIVANTGQLTANASTGIVALGLATTAVTPGTYGGASQIPYVTVDAYGRITSSANVTPSIATSQITGVLGTSQGGTNSNATPTAGAVPYGTGSAYCFTPAGSSGQILYSQGSSAPCWGNAASNYNYICTYCSNFAVCGTSACCSPCICLTGGYNSYYFIFRGVTYNGPVTGGISFNYISCCGSGNCVILASGYQNVGIFSGGSAACVCCTTQTCNFGYVAAAGSSSPSSSGCYFGTLLVNNIQRYNACNETSGVIDSIGYQINASYPYVSYGGTQLPYGCACYCYPIVMISFGYVCTWCKGSVSVYGVTSC